MNFKKIIKKHYQNYVASAQDIPSDLKIALKTHERIPAFIDNLALEIPKINRLRIKKGKKPVSVSQIKWLTEQATGLMITALINKAQAMHASDIEKSRNKKIIDSFIDKENTLKNNPTGDYADIVAEVIDERK